MHASPLLQGDASLPPGALPARFARSSFASYQPQNPAQAQALREAEAFAEQVRARKTLARRVRKLFGRGPGSDWKGLYLVGPVGTGKTHLMASMYNSLAPGIRCGFFHTAALNRLPMHPERLAHEIAHRYDVLCLDEVEIDDPANEARLVVLFKTLDTLGVVLLATSNVEPERFLAAEFGNDRFRRFLSQEFRQSHKVLLVRGEDYRAGQRKPGRAWIGPPEAARAHLRAAFEADAGRKLWMPYPELIAASAATEHARLLRRLARCESLYLPDIHIGGADEAMRLLWLVDDLYMQPAPPTFYYSSAAPAAEWLRPESVHSGLEKGIAHKFERTTSRLGALCAVVRVEAPPQPSLR